MSGETAFRCPHEIDINAMARQRAVFKLERRMGFMIIRSKVHISCKIKEKIDIMNGFSPFPEPVSESDVVVRTLQCAVASCIPDKPVVNVEIAS